MFWSEEERSTSLSVSKLIAFQLTVSVCQSYGAQACWNWEFPYVCNGEIVKLIVRDHTHSQPEFVKGLLRKNPKEDQTVI